MGDSNLPIPFDPSMNPRLLNGREVRGDGTFVVLFGEWDYVVWNYDRDVTVAEQG